MLVYQMIMGKFFVFGILGIIRKKPLQKSFSVDINISGDRKKKWIIRMVVRK